MPRDPYEAARQVTRQHARSFYFASPFLPREKRRHAYAVYALCRRLDDDVDEAPDHAAALQAVGDFGGTLDAVYAEAELEDDVLEAARRTIAACGIERLLFDDLTRGVEADLTVKRYADWVSLERYCYLVAGVVGLIMCRVFGLPDATAEQNAVAMGNAMQMTNILRDVREDWHRGRLYLPKDELHRFGIGEAEVARMSAGGDVSQAWRRFTEFQIARTRDLYEQGFAGLQALTRDGSRQTAAVMAVVYGGILGAIERQNYDVFVRRARVPMWRKVMLVPKALRMAKQEKR